MRVYRLYFLRRNPAQEIKDVDVSGGILSKIYVGTFAIEHTGKHFWQKFESTI